MKKIILISLLSLTTFASNVKESFFINDPNHIYLEMIKSHKALTLDHLHQDGYELYGPTGTKKWLDSTSIDYQKLDSLEKDLAFSGYPASKLVTEHLKEIVSKHPTFLSYEVIGKSVKGQDIISIKISDNVKKDELEPEVKLVANIHGNEIMGREVLIKLVEDIAQNYNSDPGLKELVDSTEIFIIPSLNPDGADKKRRGNHNWIDLNRNFPDFTTTDNSNDLEKREAEVKAMMTYQKKEMF